MFGFEVDPADILEGLKGIKDFEGKEGVEPTWSYQRQKDSLELFNMDILICDNVDAIFAKYRPGTFLPALCHLFMDTNAPLDVLESSARAITYFLDVHVDSTARKVVDVPGAVAAFCKALVLFPISDSMDPDTARMSRDVAEQSVKVLELLCRREAKAVFEAEGLQCLLTFVNSNGHNVHKDTLQCSLSVASMLCGRLKPDHPALPACVASLTCFLEHKIVDHALESLGSLTEMLSRGGADLAVLDSDGLVKKLLGLLYVPPADPQDLDQDMSLRTANIINLLIALCRGSPELAAKLLEENVLNAVEAVLEWVGEDKTALALLRLVDLVLTLVFRGLKAPHPKDPRFLGENAADSDTKDLGTIEAIRSGNMEALQEAVAGGSDVNAADQFGQTVLVWAAYTGTPEMAELLLESGADPNIGRNPPLHYAARFGRATMVQLLLKHGADPHLP
eukprot:CAMPEP_0206233448 /NCGR_PEP_ID=MMETSP0047_2-20121206/11995_1 /ASSEMBLY_ACC=CAM_ASM_000192 /TAXON_ID=195065 /ORGANISM="Chroomonas mesostigmatica_cf, Strain CCMP1168" /LENGTH=449 /DNA_ID=CAMNT_0053657333 /DNA_START=37 /DNA_END=1384 /DNA_ORIENTATION=+